MKLCTAILCLLIGTKTLCKNIGKNDQFLQSILVMDSHPVTKEEKKAYYRTHSDVNFSLGNATDSNAISYKLFTRKNPDDEIVLTEENVASQNLTKDIKTILIIHGWTSNDSSPWYQPLKDAYLQRGSYNIIYIDWSTYGNLSYSISSANVKPVGELIATFLGKSGVPAEEIHLIGHSLGGHLAGFIGKAYEKKYGKKVSRITALDPAGPKWSNKTMKKKEKLNELDASFVDVIHTDIQLYGYTNPCGHVDFYPNGGADQPGCDFYEEEGNCSHRRACLLFIESLSTKVKATEITFKEDENYNIIITPEKNAKQVIFGEHVELEERGVYYLETQSTYPFFK